MKLSLIILNYQSKNLVRHFLKRVLGFKLPFESEIIVVDNNSKDGIGCMIAKDFPEIKFIANPKNIGMGGGNNLGIKNSKGEYILIVNPDVFLNSEALIDLVEFLDNYPKVGIVAPKILNPDKTRQDTCYRWPKFLTFLYRRTWLGKTKSGLEHLRDFLYQDVDLNIVRQVDWVLGGCFMIKRKALDQVGLFDRRFFLFLEDTDLCRRLWRHNWQVWYLPRAEVIHLPHRLSAGAGTIKDLFSKLTWIHLSSWIEYFWKWK